MSIASDYFEDFYEPIIEELTQKLRNAESALISVSIERDHFKATVKALTDTGHAVNTAERGLKDMTGMDV